MTFECFRWTFLCAGVALAVAMTGVGRAGNSAEAAEIESAGGPPSGLKRDAVWRQIFARPSPAEGETAAMLGGKTASDMPRVRLGQQLFFDVRLSRDEDRSCASCHVPSLGFSDGRRKGLGRDGNDLARHVPALYNLAEAPRLFWDGRAATLEDQAHAPLSAQNELAGDYKVIARRLAGDVETQHLFDAAFANRPNINRDTITAALAAYVRTIVAPRTRFDDWAAGNDLALTGEEKRGFALFVGKAGCVACHGGWRFTDDRLHDIGLQGAGNETPIRWQFKTPGLRQVRNTAPYMHDGSMPTLEAVVDHYASGVRHRPTLAPQLVRNLGLTALERRELIAFLKTL